MKDFKYNEFYELVGDELDVFDGEGNQGILLIKAVVLSKFNNDEQYGFSIYFTNTNEFYLTQGTYLFRHKFAGECELFITQKSNSEYECCITQVKNS
jgi:hypothetical protein